MSERLRIEGDGNRLHLYGEFDRSEVDRFTEALIDLDGQAVDIDLAGLTFVDSAALRALMDQRIAHAFLRYRNPSQNLLRLAEITGLSEVLFGEGSAAAPTGRR
jgi:anti-anti-sigma factor